MLNKLLAVLTPIMLVTGVGNVDSPARGASHRKPVGRGSIVLDSVVTFASNGKRVTEPKLVRGLPAKAPKRLRLAETDPAVMLAKLNSVKPPRKAKYVAPQFPMLKKILAALSGPPGALHDTIAALPIRLEESTEYTDGKSRVQKKYYISGKLRAILYLSGDGGPQEAAVPLSSVPGEAGEEPETAEQPTATTEWCSDTDEWGTYWEGECTTEQESADAEATWIAVEAEATDAIATFEVASAEHEWAVYCEGLTTEEKYAQGCWVSEQSVLMFRTESAAPDGSLTGPEWGETGDLLSPACVEVIPGAMESCAAENLAALFGIASWVDSKIGLKKILTTFKGSSRILAATAGEVGWAVGLTIGSGFALGYGIGTAIHCWEM